MNIIKVISDWPVIVQGALGAALFWLVLELGQRVIRKVSKKLGEDRQTANWFSLAGHYAPVGELRNTGRFICLYGAMHYLLKALIVAVLAFAVSGFIAVFADVGYFICVYFLFRALAFVPHTSHHGQPEEAKKKFLESVKKIREKNSPPQNPNARNDANPA